MSENCNRPLVSVIIIFYNAASFFDEAITSVLAQTYEHWELFLVDDGSIDESTEIALRYAKQFPDKVFYLEHEGHVNRGMSATRNLGIRHARGKYVAFLDADDIWLPQKLQHQVTILEAQPDVGMLYGPTEYWYSWTGNSEDRERDHVPDLNVPLDSLIEPPKLLTMLYPLGHGQAPCPCSLLVRRSVLHRIGGFEDSFTGYYEDQVFLTKVYLGEKVFVSSGCWDKYRIHPDSCCAEVARSGQRDRYRKAYLDWCKHFLMSRGVQDPNIWKAVDSAIRTSALAPKTSEPKWCVRVAEGNQARFAQTAGQSNVLRVEISKNVSEQAYDTQLNLSKLKVSAATRCILSFQARADAPREISFGFAMGHSPWANLGVHDCIQLTTEWQWFEREFVIVADEYNARIHFDLGGSDISVDLCSVTLLDPSEGRFIEQEHSFAEDGQSLPIKTPVEPVVPVNEVDFGSFRRLTPISRDFGCDRGRPIDRYYIESFLKRHEADVRGSVLEIGENTYTRRFGGDRITQSDILHVTEGEPQATIIADLASADHIPSNSFDCIILTQTLQLIYDVPAALRTIRRILKPSGVLLATFPGISQSYDPEWAKSWYWNFTTVSARRLFEEAYAVENVCVEAFGNVLAAMTFLHGLAVEELTREELDYREPGYDVTIAARAVKPPVNRHDDLGDGAIGKSKLAPRDRIATESPRAIILMYHRIAEGGTDPFSLCVAPDRFAEQLEVLRKSFDFMGLRDFVAKLGNGGILRPTVVITFDDGYVDNLLNAKPLLEHYDVPATVFITTGSIGGQHEFWWDELDRLLLQPGILPQILRISINGITHEWDLGEAKLYSVEQWRNNCAWTVMQEAPTARHRMYLEVWRLLQFLPDAERRQTLEELRLWARALAGGRATHRQLSGREVAELATCHLIEAGAHTVTHPVLSRLPVDLQRAEIQQSTQRVEELVGYRVASFAYPFGSRPDFSDETIALVKECGCTCACATVHCPVQWDSDCFQLPRLQVENWDGDEFDRWMYQWLS